MIHIENKKTYRGEGIYVGRKIPGVPGSVLGNPFRIRRDGTRVQVISNYRRWLWEQIKLKNEAYDELRRIAELCTRKIKFFTEPSLQSIREKIKFFTELIRTKYTAHRAKINTGTK
jgi:hypothetical protein